MSKGKSVFETDKVLRKKLQWTNGQLIALERVLQLLVDRVGVQRRVANLTADTLSGEHGALAGPENEGYHETLRAILGDERPG